MDSSSQWLLDVYVLTSSHRRRSNYGMGVIRGSNEHRFDVFLLIQHCLEVRVLAGFAVLLLPSRPFLSRSPVRVCRAFFDLSLDQLMINVADRHDVFGA